MKNDKNTIEEKGTNINNVVDNTVEQGSQAPRGKVVFGKRIRNTARNNERASRVGRPQRGQGRGEGKERVKSEFDSKMIDIRRVSRVVAGGRRYNFSVAVVVGDKKGRVGIGLGKGADTALAIEKATREAKKQLVKISVSPQMTIPHAIEAKYSSARVKVFPARDSGVVAGSSARAVIEMAGIRDICVKIMSGSKNKVNIAKATIKALNSIIKIPKSILIPKK